MKICHLKHNNSIVSARIDITRFEDIQNYIFQVILVRGGTLDHDQHVVLV